MAHLKYDNNVLLFCLCPICVAGNLQIQANHMYQPLDKFDLAKEPEVNNNPMTWLLLTQSGKVYSWDQRRSTLTLGIIVSLEDFTRQLVWVRNLKVIIINW
jgi:hypothetical protein